MDLSRLITVTPILPEPTNEEVTEFLKPKAEIEENNEKFEDLPVLKKMEKQPVEKSHIDENSEDLLLMHDIFEFSKNFEHDTVFKKYEGFAELKRLPEIYGDQKLSTSNPELYRNLRRKLIFSSPLNCQEKAKIDNEFPELFWPTENSDFYRNLPSDNNVIIRGKKQNVAKLLDIENQLLAALNENQPQTIQVLWNNNIYNIPKRMPCSKCEENMSVLKRVVGLRQQDLKLKCPNCKKICSFTQYVKINVSPPSGRITDRYVLMKSPAEDISEQCIKEELLYIPNE